MLAATRTAAPSPVRTVPPTAPPAPAPPACRVYTFATGRREAVVAETYAVRGARRLAFRVVTLTPNGAEGQRA